MTRVASQVELYTTYTIYCSVRRNVRHLAFLSRACHSNRSIIDATGHAQLIARLVSQLGHIISIPNAALVYVFEQGDATGNDQGVIGDYISINIKIIHLLTYILTIIHIINISVRVSVHTPACHDVRDSASVGCVQ